MNLSNNSIEKGFSPINKIEKLSHNNTDYSCRIIYDDLLSKD